jgi:hypothetical protein
MMRKFLVELLPLTPSNCVADVTCITGVFTIAKFQSVKIVTNETQYQRVVLKVQINSTHQLFLPITALPAFFSKTCKI